LRLAILGAAAIPVELIEQMRVASGSSASSRVSGSPSSGIVSMCRYDDPEIIAHTCGRPLRGSVRVVSDGCRRAERPGEILVRGYTLMRGYLDDPEQTAATIDGDGWLHTGDIGVMRTDGNLAITDRKKDMFVVGGFNVYPAEIENVMASHPHIGQLPWSGCPTIASAKWASRTWCRARTSPSSDEIIGWCRDEMANYSAARSRSSTHCR
jgi:acyl-CoA synthetase (AMP-forming)/AMP-acid ligase II